MTPPSTQTPPWADLPRLSPPHRREPGNKRRWSLGFVGKEVPIIAFIRLTPAVSLCLSTAEDHTHTQFSCTATGDLCGPADSLIINL